MAPVPRPQRQPYPAAGEGLRLHIENVPAARRLRRDLTPTEAILWERLRSRRCMNLKFRRQHPIGRFVVDFYCEETMVAVEIEGGYHLDPGQRGLDLERQLELEQRGIRFVRIPAELITKDTAALMSYLNEIFSLQKQPLSRNGRGAGVREDSSARPPGPHQQDTALPRRERGDSDGEPSAPGQR